MDKSVSNTLFENLLKTLRDHSRNSRVIAKTTLYSTATIISGSLCVLHLFLNNGDGGGLKTTKVKILPWSNKNRDQHRQFSNSTNQLHFGVF